MSDPVTDTPKRPGNSKSRRSADGHEASGAGYGGPSKPNRILPRTAEGQARGTATVARMTGDERKARQAVHENRREQHLDLIHESIVDPWTCARDIYHGSKTYSDMTGLTPATKHELTGKDGSPLSRMATMTDAELEAIANEDDASSGTD